MAALSHEVELAAPPVAPTMGSSLCYRIEPITSADIPTLGDLRAASISPSSSVWLVSDQKPADTKALADQFCRDYIALLGAPGTIAVKAVDNTGTILGSGALQTQNPSAPLQTKACPVSGDALYWQYMQTLKVRP
jgi:hypothetical protein